MKEQDKISIHAVAAEILSGAKGLIAKQDPLRDVNIFTILGMESKEVSAHSAFLYSVFKPFWTGDGTIDDKNLRMLYGYLRKNKYLEGPEDPENIDVLREVAFEEGRLDFLISFSADHVINAAVIELKVWAGEQPNQIERYRDYMVENGYSENNIFFLTPSGYSATTGNAIPISLKVDMKTVLHAISADRNIPEYTSVINQYLKIIDKLTGGDSMAFTDLIKNRSDVIAVDALIDAKIESMNMMTGRFMDDLESVFSGYLKTEYAEAELQKLGGIKLTCRDDVEIEENAWLDAYRFYNDEKKYYPAIIYEISGDDSKEMLFKHGGLEKGRIDEDTYGLFFYIEIGKYLFGGITPRRNVIQTLSPFHGMKKSKGNGLVFFDDVFISKQNARCDGEISFYDYKGRNGVLRLTERSEGLFVRKDYVEEIAKDLFNSFLLQYQEIRSI